MLFSARFLRNEEVNKTVERIFAQNAIHEIGFCAFDTVREHLLPCRAAARLPENAKSIILCLFPYKVKEAPPKNISRYAAVPDYHTVCGAMLEKAVGDLEQEFPQNRFVSFIDNSPIPEVYAAACAGLGVRGENGLLIHPRYGSWCFIGEVVTDLPLLCKNEPRDCDRCGICAGMCPKNEGGGCLSAISQQKKPPDEKQTASLKKHGIVWGCDLCAENCPMNRNAQKTDIKAFVEGYRDHYEIGEPVEGRAYEWRGAAVVARNAKNLSEKSFGDVK